MESLFLLSKFDLKLSEAELCEFLGITEKKRCDNFLISDISALKFEGLAYTKAAYRILFSSSLASFEKRFQEYPWDSLKGSFCIRIYDSSRLKSENKLVFTSEILADHVWKKQKDPKVDMKKAENNIEIFEFGKKFYCCVKVWENTEKFEERKPHKKPRMLPISLDPRLARCLVNLTGVQKGKVYDPFCGVGGILVEAGLRGLNPVGTDISEYMLKAASENLQFYHVSDYSLSKKDALKIVKKWDYVVTDLPYSKNTRKTSVDLYSDFMKLLKKIVAKQAVIVMHDDVPHSKLVKISGLKVKYKFSYYIHKSMSKMIYVLER